jgi:hypothetical protein
VLFCRAPQYSYTRRCRPIRASSRSTSNPRAIGAWYDSGRSTGPDSPLERTPATRDGRPKEIANSSLLEPRRRRLAGGRFFDPHLASAGTITPGCEKGVVGRRSSGPRMGPRSNQTAMGASGRLRNASEKNRDALSEWPAHSFYPQTLYDGFP